MDAPPTTIFDFVIPPNLLLSPPARITPDMLIPIVNKDKQIVQQLPAAFLFFSSWFDN
jgi:hypothetical protein